MLAPPPPRFSTTICWPQISDSLPATTRAMASVPPPGGNGTTNRTKRLGQVDCAEALRRKLGAGRAFASAAAPASLMEWRRLSIVYSLTLMLAALMTGPHLAISSLRCAPSASGVEPIGIRPRLSSLAFTAGSASVAALSVYILWMISGGVLAGMKKANHDDV